MGRAEGREIVTTDEMRCAFVHRIGIERHGDMPGAARSRAGGARRLRMR